MGEDSGEKTEEPTSHKLREARKKGQISKSKEITSALLVLASFYTFKSVAVYMWNKIGEIESFSFIQMSEEFSGPVMGVVLLETLYMVLLTMAPLFAVNLLVALIVEALQTGFLVSFDSIKPNFAKLNPIEGFKKFFSMKQYVELFKNLFKLFIVVWLIISVVKARINFVLVSMSLSLWQVMQGVGDIVMTVVTRLVIFYLFMALFDYFYQRYEYMKSMKMSKKEIKDEYKRLEGDPMVKQRQRDAQRQMAMGRQMGAVPGADVVVTNPVHVAIALVYKKGEMKAPTVLAKGRRLVAEEIKRIAEEYYVPIVENPPIARAIFKTTPVGGAIPFDYYKVVAEILAFVYNLKKKRKMV